MQSNNITVFSWIHYHSGVNVAVYLGCPSRGSSRFIPRCVYRLPKLMRSHTLRPFPACSLIVDRITLVSSWRLQLVLRAHCVNLNLHSLTPVLNIICNDGCVSQTLSIPPPLSVPSIKQDSPPPRPHCHKGVNSSGEVSRRHSNLEDRAGFEEQAHGSRDTQSVVAVTTPASQGCHGVAYYIRPPKKQFRATCNLVSFYRHRLMGKVAFMRRDNDGMTAVFRRYYSL